MKRAVIAGALLFDADLIVAAAVALFRGWSADHFSSALVAMGIVAGVVSGMMFFGPGSRVSAPGARTKESVFTRGRLPAAQSGHDWLEGRTGGPGSFVIGAFISSVAAIATGMVIEYAF